MTSSPTPEPAPRFGDAVGAGCSDRVDISDLSAQWMIGDAPNLQELTSPICGQLLTVLEVNYTGNGRAEGNPTQL
jgi:hypothetical protein